MKRLILALLVTISFLAIPAVALAQPVYEDWEFFSARDHTAYGYYTINTTNLQVDSFTLVNNTTIDTLHLTIYRFGELIFAMDALPGQTVSNPITNFKFQRLPATDPDDPNSVRYPNGVTISCGN